MAKKKPYNPQVTTPTNQHLYSSFIKDLISGVITASKLYDFHKKNQKAKFEFDDPNDN